MLPGDHSYFTLPEDDEAIKKRIEICPKALINLGGYGIEEGASLIEKRLRALYTPTPQIIGLVRAICGIGLAHLKETYIDLADFEAKCKAFDLVPENPRSATALVGLGGAGKTKLLRAIARLVTPEGAHVKCPNGPYYPVQAMWIMTMVSGMSLSKLLEPFIGSGNKPSAILTAAAKRAFTNGLGLACLDESQFITSTQEGHAKAGAMLMRLTYIGPPFIYGANFTLINKLKRRPQQERDRLLSNVMVLYPEEYGSDAFRDILSDQLTVLAEAVSGESAINVRDHAQDIYRYTYGINRKVAILLTEGWRVSRERGSQTITMDDISDAYKSKRFMSHREEVEILYRQSITRKMVREDLWCDFAPPRAYFLIQPPPAAKDPGANSSDNVISLTEATKEKEKSVADEMARETMTKSDREAYDLATNRRAKMAKPKAKVVRMSKEEKSLAALQQAGAEMLERFSPKS